MCKQIVVIHAENPEEFQKAFNSKMSELQDLNPTYEFNHGLGYCAYIIYSDKPQINGVVKPANRCICDTCARLQELPGRHVKWRKCDIYGAVKRDTSCDDYIPGGGYYGN